MQITIYFSIPYPIHLGLLVTVWTAFISSTPDKDEYYRLYAPLRTSIFPGRDPSVHIILHENSDSGTRFHKPLEYDAGRNFLPGLMTIQAWLNGGHEIASVRILACVKSIGPKKPITTKTNKSLELQEVKLSDDTGETVLKLWNANTVNGKYWMPGKTILLISQPQYRFDYGKGSMGLGVVTMIDVEPECADAEWLRKWADGLMKRESLKMELEDGLFDHEAFETGRERPLFRISDIDEW